MGDPGEDRHNAIGERLARIEEGMAAVCRSTDGLRADVRVLTDPGRGLCGQHSRKIQALESRQDDLRSGIKHLWKAVVVIFGSIVSVVLAWLFHRGTG